VTWKSGASAPRKAPQSMRASAPAVRACLGSLGTSYDAEHNPLGSVGFENIVNLLCFIGCGDVDLIKQRYAEAKELANEFEKAKTN